MKTGSSTNRPYPQDMGDTFGQAVRRMGGWGPYYKWLHQQRQPIVSKRLPGRNEPCHCGSGKKFKKCCISK